MLNLLIADDHKIFRQGLINLLQDVDEIEVVADVGDGVEAWHKIQEITPDIAVLDFSMPELDGLAVAELIQKNKIATQIILLTMHDEPMILGRSIKLGVKGYVLKDNAFDEFVEAINTVNSGQSFISHEVKKKFDKYSLNTTLSSRETTVLKLIAQGLTNKEIAIQLDVSHKTIDTYRARLMNKLNLHSVAELTRYAIKMGLSL